MKEVKPKKALEFEPVTKEDPEKKWIEEFKRAGASNNELKQIYLQKEILRLLKEIGEKL